MLDRTTPPPIRQLSEFSITRPDRRTMKNGMPLNIIHAGTEDVVRFDLLIGGGQWNQEQPLQAMFANRMLREGAGNLTSSQIAERLDYYGAWLELSSSVNYGFITLYSLNKYFARTLPKEYAESETPVLCEAKRWLDICFSGREPDFTPPLHPVGSAFQQAVWALLLEIPYGKTSVPKPKPICVKSCKGQEISGFKEKRLWNRTATRHPVPIGYTLAFSGGGMPASPA